MSALHKDGQVIGLDVGGTKILGSSTDETGGLFLTYQEATQTRSSRALVDQIHSIIRNLRDDRPLKAVAIGVPAAVHPTTGKISLSPNVPLEGCVDLVAQISARIDAPAFVENDVNLATLGEATLGAGKTQDSVCLLNFGTGVGMGTIINGAMVTGQAGLAGEVGALAVRGTTVEELIGTPAILKRTQLKSVRDLFAMAHSGDQAARKEIFFMAEIAAQTIETIGVILDPDVLILGGGIGTQSAFREAIDEVRGTARSHNGSLKDSHTLNIQTARLGSKAGMIGALLLAAQSANLPNITL